MIPALFSAFEALRPAFSRQRSYYLVTALLTGLIFSGKYTTLTLVFLQLDTLLPGVVHRYWSLPALLARRRWNCQELIVLFLRFVLEKLPGGYLLADVTHTVTQGRHQQGRHFRPNPKYRKHQQNQSKFLAGNSALSLAYVAHEQTRSGLVQWVFGLGCLLLRPSRRSGSESAMLRRAIMAIAPPGMLIVYDRRGNDAATINRFHRGGKRFITRLNANAAIYRDAACRQKIDPWCYQTTLARDGKTIYRYEVLCYRKKVCCQLKAVIEIAYNRHRRRWQVSYYISTDTEMSAEQIVNAYRSRRQIEGVHADSKLCCGFNSCRVHSANSIEAYLSLSLLAAGLLEYLRYSLRHLPATLTVSTHEILQKLGMHWYHPTALTRGLVSRYLEHQLTSNAETLSTFRASFSRQVPVSP
jgi:hypothetical protein